MCLVSYDGSSKAAGLKILCRRAKLPGPLTVNADKLKDTIKTEKPLHLGLLRGHSRFPFQGAGSTTCSFTAWPWPRATSADLAAGRTNNRRPGENPSRSLPPSARLPSSGSPAY